MSFSSRGRDPTDRALGMEPSIRKLSAFAYLDGEDLQVLRSLKVSDRFGVGRALNTPNSPHPRMRFLLSGWAARQRLLTDGRRQILQIVLPGDIVGFSELDAPSSGVSVVALTTCETADAGFVGGGGLMRGSQTLQAAVAGAEALEQWLLIEQVVRLGRRTALERSAHLLLEIEMRLNLAGLADEGRFPLPVTQEILSDVLGLSIVHVNRTFLQLRRERWIDMRNRQVELLRKRQLAELADFQPPPPLADVRPAPPAESARIGWL